MKFLLLVLMMAVLAVVVYQLFSGGLGGRPGSTRRLEVARWRVRAVTDVAYAHDEISAGLAGGIIELTRGLNDDDSVHTLEKAIEDVLALARSHRGDEPDLAVIVIDTLRREEGPSQIG